MSERSSSPAPEANPGPEEDADPDTVVEVARFRHRHEAELASGFLVDAWSRDATGWRRWIGGKQSGQRAAGISGCPLSRFGNAQSVWITVNSIPSVWSSAWSSCQRMKTSSVVPASRP